MAIFLQDGKYRIEKSLGQGNPGTTSLVPGRYGQARHVVAFSMVRLLGDDTCGGYG